MGAAAHLSPIGIARADDRAAVEADVGRRLPPSMRPFRMQFAVERVWKGSVPAMVWVVDLDGPCRGTYKFDRRYQVWADGPVHRELTGMCGLSLIARPDFDLPEIADWLGHPGWTPPRPHWLAVLPPRTAD